MELERTTFDYLKRYLISHGYPEEAIVSEYALSPNIRVDVAIVDPKTDTPILIFEIKSRKTPQLIDAGKKQLKKQLEQIPDKKTPSYLVFPKEDSPFFEVIRVFAESEDENMPLLDFTSSKNARYSERRETIKLAKKKTAKIFRRICWGLSVILALMFILYKSNLINISSQDILIISYIIALIIIPFSNKLKIFGIEYERFQ